MDNVKVMTSNYIGNIVNNEIQVTFPGMGNFNSFVLGLCAHVLMFTSKTSPLYVDPQINEENFHVEPTKRAYERLGLGVKTTECGWSNVWINHALLIQKFVESSAQRQLYLDHESRIAAKQALTCFGAWRKSNIEAIQRKRGERFGSATGWQTNNPLEFIYALEDKHYEMWEFDNKIFNGRMALRITDREDRQYVSYYDGINDFVKRERRNGRFFKSIVHINRYNMETGVGGHAVSARTLEHAFNEEKAKDKYWLENETETFEDCFCNYHREEV